MAHLEKILPHYTYDDYVLWEGRWELIKGHPIAMSPMPIPKHQWVCANIISEFRNALKQADCKQCKAYMPIDYKLAEDTILQPDALIVCSPITKKFLDFTPELVVEVLSPTTALRDRNLKFKLYEAEGVKYYVLVNIESELVELYELQDSRYVLMPVLVEEPSLLQLHDNSCKAYINWSSIWI